MFGEFKVLMRELFGYKTMKMVLSYLAVIITLMVISVVAKGFVSGLFVLFSIIVAVGAIVSVIKEFVKNSQKSSC